MDNKLHLAPLNNPQDVLDIGTGTGIWAIEFADEYPEAKVIGIDLSPIQPSFVPPNVTFLVDDAEEQWMYSQQFDYIHGRMMTSSFTEPIKVFKQAFSNLKPGGYFEMQDIIYPIKCDDDSMKDGSAVLEWSKTILKASEKMGKSLDQALQYRDWMRETGFVDIQETIYKWPVNTWPKGKKFKEMGMWTLENLMAGFQGLSMALLTRGLGWTRDEVEAYLVEARQDAKDRKKHGYFPIHVFVAKKPESAT
ncbi:MAG: hypothetical protein M1834_001186 [Cirrosporium novae-zelandiae]|nr:MAG: hypothetical protein M1834_001186 [Cirrosporium novae-zelandiae]